MLTGTSMKERSVMEIDHQDDDFTSSTPDKFLDTPPDSPQYKMAILEEIDDEENPHYHRKSVAGTPKPPTIFYKGKNARPFLNFADPRLAETVSPKKKFYLYMTHILRFFLSTIGALVFWVGLWDMYETYWFPYTLETEIVLIFAGLFLYFLLIILFKIPFMERLEHRKGWIGWIFRTLRDTAAIFCCVAVWKGAYNIIDVYIFDYSWTRSGLYLVIGFFFMTITGGLKGNVQI